MMLHYGLTITDYKDNRTFVLYWDTNKNNVLEELEKIVYDYINEKNGYRYNQKIFNKGESGRPYTYFIYRNPTKCINKYKIKYKELIRGYLYNSAKIDNIVAYYITESYFLNDLCISRKRVYNAVEIEEIKQHKEKNKDILKSIFEQMENFPLAIKFRNNI